MTFEVLSVLRAFSHVLGLLRRMSVLFCASISFIVIVVRDIGFDLQLKIWSLSCVLSHFLSANRTADLLAKLWARKHALTRGYRILAGKLSRLEEVIRTSVFKLGANGY
jgi:hypothetical protein